MTSSRAGAADRCSVGDPGRKLRRKTSTLLRRCRWASAPSRTLGARRRTRSAAMRPQAALALQAWRTCSPARRKPELRFRLQLVFLSGCVVTGSHLASMQRQRLCQC